MNMYVRISEKLSFILFINTLLVVRMDCCHVKIITLYYLMNII